MKSIGSCFTVGFRHVVWNVARRTLASDAKPIKLNEVKPHERSGVLSAVEKDHSGFPSYLILKETSPILSEIAPPTNLNDVKPHERSGVLSAVEKDRSGFPSYLILKETSPILSQAIIDVKSKKKNKKTSHILLEGKRLIQDALNAGVKPKQIFFSQKRVLENLCLPEELRDLSVSQTIFYKAPYKMIQLFSDTETSQGILGIFETPIFEQKVKNAFPITVICDNIREPGNLGAVLRTLTAVGVSQIILMKGCTDLWGNKVLRAGCGAHFRMNIFSDVSWSSLVNIKGQVCLADNNLNSKDVESNVTEGGEVNVFGKIAPIELPIVPYYEVDYCKTIPLILVVGGETQGLSDDGYNFAKTRQGIRVNIPLSNGMESLNSATAIGILCFEAKKQMLNLAINGDEIDKIELAN